ncbi:unnamed protein product [Ectocarpus sp. 4 AP-2014]
MYHVRAIHAVVRKLLNSLEMSSKAATAVNCTRSTQGGSRVCANAKLALASRHGGYPDALFNDHVYVCCVYYDDSSPTFVVGRVRHSSVYVEHYTFQCIFLHNYNY